MACLREQDYFSQFIHSIIIPKGCKAELKKELEKDGWTEDWLFMKNETKDFTKAIDVIIADLHNGYGLV